eukprot:COSAG01_NODE_6850_length_3469_cov_240.717211_2_plen_75_part_00
MLVHNMKFLLLLAVCVNQRLFITNTGPPLGVYTCPHKEGYDVTLSLLVVYILTVPSPSPPLPDPSASAACQNEY